MSTGTALKEDGMWNIIATQTSQSENYILQTGRTYVDSNINVYVQVPGIVIPTPTVGESEFYITIGGVTYTWHVNSAGNVWVD